MALTFAEEGTVNPTGTGVIETPITIEFNTYNPKVCKVNSTYTYDNSTCAYSLNREEQDNFPYLDQTSNFRSATGCNTVNDTRNAVSFTASGDVTHNFQYNGGNMTQYEPDTITEVCECGVVTGYLYKGDEYNTSQTLSQTMHSYTNTTNPMYVRDLYQK